MGGSSDTLTRTSDHRYPEVPMMDAGKEQLQQDEGLVLVRRKPPAPQGLCQRLEGHLRWQRKCSLQGAWALLQMLVPAMQWLPRYQPRKDLAGDVLSGLVIGIILVPQAIAYSLLAGLLPIYSLYTSFFANLIYFLLGTSRHVSVGIFSLLCLMVGQVVDRELLLAGFNPVAAMEGPGQNLSTHNSSATALEPQQCGRDCYAIRVACALTLMTGIYQVSEQRGRHRESKGGSMRRVAPGLPVRTPESLLQTLYP